MSIDRFFNSTAVVNQVANTQNAMGGPVKAYSTRIASLPCRITPRKIDEGDERGKMTTTGVWRLYCHATATNKLIAQSDQVVASGRTFEVKGVSEPGLLGRHLEIDLLEIN